MTLVGAPALMRAFPQWFAWRPMREAVRAANMVARATAPGRLSAIAPSARPIDRRRPHG